MNTHTPKRSGACGLPWRRNRSRSGFSVIETVIACTIILIVLAGSYLILDSSMDLTRTARDGYAATTISNARLERARMITYSDLPTLAESNTRVDDYGLPADEGRFRRTTTISTNQPQAGCTLVAVSTDVRKPNKAGQISSDFYNTKTLTCVYTPYDSPP